MDKFALTAQLLMQAPANLMQTVRTVRNAFKDIDVNVKVKTDVRALQGIENDLKRLRDAGKQTSQFYNEIGGILANATRRFAGISIATGTFLGLARAIKNGIGDAIVFEREMAKIAQATDSSIHATRELAKEIGEIGKKYGSASDELVKFARNFAQAGFNAKETSAALDLLARTDVIGTFGTMESTMEGIITTQAVFNKSIKGSAESIQFLESTFDAINKVSKKYAIESDDIITAVRRTGAVFEAAGGSVNELMAIMTSVRATTRESADTIANGFKTIFTRLQRKDTLDSLKELGVELEDLNGKFIGPYQAIQKIGIALSALPEGSIQKNNILEQIGGVYQIGRLIPAIKNYALQQQILNEANSASGDINKDLGKSQETLAIKIMKTKEAFASFVREFALSDRFKDGVNIVLSYANAFISLAKSLEGVLPYLAAYASISAAKTAGGFLTSFMGGKVKTPKTGAGRALAGNQVGGYATGGFVSGAPGIDKNPAMLTDGEFVVNRKDAQKNKGLLAAINSGRKVRMLSGGSEKLPGGSGVSGGSKDYSAIINQFTHELKNLVKIMGPDAKKLKEALGNDLRVHDINIDPQGKSVTERAIKEGFKGVNGFYSGQNKKIILNPQTATSDTVRHELGHAADRSGIKGTIPNNGLGPQLPSQISGTINNIIAKAATDKNVEISKNKGESEKFNKYRARPEEAFADLFKRAEPEGRALLVNLSSASTDTKKVNDALKKLAVSIQTGQVSFDQVTDANILQVARTRGVIQATKNNSTQNQSATPSAAGFVALSSVVSSAKNMAKEQARVKREEAERVKEQFSGMKSSSPKKSSGGSVHDKEEEAVQATDRTGIALFTMVSAITYATENLTKFDDETKKAVESAAAAGAIFFSLAKTSLPLLSDGILKAQDILTNAAKYIGISSKAVVASQEIETASNIKAAASEEVEIASNIKSASTNAAKGAGFATTANIAIVGLTALVVALQYAGSVINSIADNLAKDSDEEIKNIGKRGSTKNSLESVMGDDITSYQAKKLSNNWFDTLINQSEIDRTANLSKAKVSAADTSFLYGKTNDKISRSGMGPEEAAKELDRVSGKIIDNAKLAEKTFRGIELEIGGLSKTKEQKDQYNVSKDVMDNSSKLSQDLGLEYFNKAFETIALKSRDLKDSKDVSALVNSKEIKDLIDKATKAFEAGSTGTDEQKKAANKAFQDTISSRKTQTTTSLEENINAQNNANVAREAEIKLMIQFNAQLSSLTQSTLDLENAQDSLDIAMGKSSGGINPKRFSNISRVGNMKNFEDDANATGKNYGIENITKELVAGAKVIEQLRKNIPIDEANNLDRKAIRSEQGTGLVRKYLEDNAPNFNDMNKEIQKSFIAHIKDLLGSGKMTFENFSSTLDKLSADYKTHGEITEGLISAGKRQLDITKNIVQSLSDLELAIENLNGGLIDIAETGKDRMSNANRDRATNGDLDKDIRSRQAARGDSMRARLGALGNGVSSPQDLGNILTKLQAELRSNEKQLLPGSGISDEVQKKLATANIKLEKSIKSVTNELTRLTDQSARAADVMSQLDREQSKKDFVKGKMSDYVLGGAEDRMSIQEQFQALQHVMMSGSFQGLPEDLRKAVNGLGDEISKSDPNSKFVKGINNAKANDANRMFGRLPPELDRVLRGGASNKEDQLIDELKKINAEEIAAQKLLITAEEANTKAIIDLTGALNNNKNAQVPVGGQAVPGGQAPFGNPILPQAKMGGMGANQDDERTPRQKLGDKLRAKKSEIADIYSDVNWKRRSKREDASESMINEFEQSKKTQRDEELKYQEEEQVRKEIRDANEARKLEAKKPENQPHNIAIAKRRKEYEDALASTPGPDKPSGIMPQVGLEKASGIPHEYPDMMNSRTGSRDDYGPNGMVKPSKPTDFSGLGPNQGSFADQANNKLNGAMNWWNNPMTQYHGPIKGSRDGVEWGSPINSNIYGTKKPEIGSVQDSSRGFFPQLGEVINKDLGSGVFIKSKAQEEQDKKDKRMAEYERSHWGESLSRGYARGGVIGADNMVGVQSGEGIIHKTAMSKIGKNGLQAINSGLSGGGAGINISSLNTFTNNLKTTLESAINKIPEAMNTFSSSMGTITTSLNGIAQSLSNITMKHEVNIGGQLSVAGFNTEKVAEALKDSLGEFISIAVKDSIDKQNKAFRTA